MNAEERLLRKDIQDHKEQAKLAMQNAKLRKHTDDGRYVPASIQDQKKKYDYYSIKNDNIILERDEGDNSKGIKVDCTLNKARTW